MQQILGDHCLLAPTPCPICPQVQMSLSPEHILGLPTPSAVLTLALYHHLESSSAQLSKMPSSIKTNSNLPPMKPSLTHLRTERTPPHPRTPACLSLLLPVDLIQYARQWRSSSVRVGVWALQPDPGATPQSPDLGQVASYPVKGPHRVRG